jgi:hypothetical protein
VERLPSYLCMCSPACAHLTLPFNKYSDYTQISPIKGNPLGLHPSQPNITDSRLLRCCHTCLHPQTVCCPVLIIQGQPRIPQGPPGCEGLSLPPTTLAIRAVYPVLPRLEPLPFLFTGSEVLESASDTCFPLLGAVLPARQTLRAQDQSLASPESPSSW